MDQTEQTGNHDHPEGRTDEIQGGDVADFVGGKFATKSEVHKENCSTDTTSHCKRLPFWVDIKRDWLALGISLSTLVLLCFTAFYSHHQWKASAAQARAAYETLKEMKENSKSDDAKFLAQLARVDANLGQTQLLSAAAGKQAVETEALAVAARRQATQTEVLAKATNDLALLNSKAVAISGQQLDSSQRPWMNVELFFFLSPGHATPIYI